MVDPKLDYTSTVAPVIIGNHVVLGIGGDHMDNPGFIEARDPETGALQWKTNTTPRKGEPGMIRGRMNTRQRMEPARPGCQALTIRS